MILPSLFLYSNIVLVGPYQNILKKFQVSIGGEGATGHFISKYGQNIAKIDHFFEFLYTVTYTLILPSLFLYSNIVLVGPYQNIKKKFGVSIGGE